MNEYFLLLLLYEDSSKLKASTAALRMVVQQLQLHWLYYFRNSCQTNSHAFPLLVRVRESVWIGGHNRTNIQTLLQTTDYRQELSIPGVCDVRVVLLPPVV